MSLISQYIDAHNDAIRTGNLEADLIHKETYRLWQEAQRAKERLVHELADQIRTQARTSNSMERRELLDELDREVARIGDGCQVLQL